MFSEVVERVTAADDAALLGELRELEGAARELEARRAVVLAELDRRKTYRRDEHASMWGLLRATLQWSDGDCRQAMQIARLVDEHPDVGETLFEHQASVANVAAIARVRANPRVGERVDEVIGGWLRRAEHTEYDEFSRSTRTWEQRQDAKHARQLTDAADDRRTAIWGSNEHGGGLAAEWGAVDAIANREILDQYLHAEWLADWEATVERYGDEASRLLMPRSDDQRRADALTRALHDAASREPGARAPEPVVNVHVDHGTYSDLLVEAELFPERDVDPFTTIADERDRMCRTDHGDPIDPHTVLQLMLLGHVRYVIRNEEGVPVRWGRKRRLFEGPARDAVRSMATRCTHPGCRVRLKRTQTDHTVDFARGGPTEPANGNPRCLRHNLSKNRGFTVWRDQSGAWHTYRPDGTEVA